MTLINIPSDYEVVQKFGRLPDIDSGDTNEEIWDGEGAYSFPSAATTMTVSSESANDDGDPVGTGARTVSVIGLDENWQVTVETVTMNGQTGVTLSTDLLRVYRSYVVTAGSVEANDGNIWVGTGSITAGVPDTKYAGILAGNGQTLMAVYTVPDLNASGDSYSGGVISRWYGTVGAVQNAFAVLALQTRTDGSGWRTRKVVGVAEGAYMDQNIPWGIDVPTKTDVRIRALSNGANNTTIESGFDLLLYY